MKPSSLYIHILGFTTLQARPQGLDYLFDIFDALQETSAAHNAIL